MRKLFLSIGAIAIAVRESGNYSFTTGKGNQQTALAMGGPRVDDGRRTQRNFDAGKYRDASGIECTQGSGGKSNSAKGCKEIQDCPMTTA
jgi:hypothetical protein